MRKLHSAARLLLAHPTYDQCMLANLMNNYYEVVRHLRLGYGASLGTVTSRA